MSIEDQEDDEYLQAEMLSLESGSARAARSLVLRVLERNPDHVQANILLGELFLLRDEELGMDRLSACAQALELFEGVLMREPRHAEAWSQKALALLYLERFDEALDAANSGLEVLPLRVGLAMSGSGFYTNIAEALYDRKVRALLDLDRRPEAFAVLSDGLAACPESEYLTRLVEELSPDLLPDTE
jgi:tetratricopeptide (TPR) repeat protein